MRLKLLEEKFRASKSNIMKLSSCDENTKRIDGSNPTFTPDAFHQLGGEVMNSIDHSDEIFHTLDRSCCYSDAHNGKVANIVGVIPDSSHRELILPVSSSIAKERVRTIEEGFFNRYSANSLRG